MTLAAATDLIDYGQVFHLFFHIAKMFKPCHASLELCVSSCFVQQQILNWIKVWPSRTYIVVFKTFLCGLFMFVCFKIYSLPSLSCLEEHNFLQGSPVCCCFYLKVALQFLFMIQCWICGMKYTIGSGVLCSVHHFDGKNSTECRICNNGSVLSLCHRCDRA